MQLLALGSTGYWSGSSLGTGELPAGNKPDIASLHATLTQQALLDLKHLDYEQGRTAVPLMCFYNVRC